MAYGNTFKRHEMKFVLTEQQYRAVRQAIEPYMTGDEYGRHSILNIYCDSDSSELIRLSLGKPIYKEKLRLRSYGTATDDSASFLEIKKKFKGVVYKRRVKLPYKAAFDYINGGALPHSDSLSAKEKQQLAEIDYMIKRLSLKPKIVICYDRRAFYGNEDSEFRITFDGNIRYRTDNLDLRKGGEGKALAKQPYCVMEIKVAAAIPLWMTKILSELNIYKGSFSKYGNIFCEMLTTNDNGGTIGCSLA